jgi:DNA invertase Pin-like site-specific DNA recombinase
MVAIGERAVYTPIDQREPASVRAVILSRESDGPDVATQVKRCLDFIKERGWTLVADPYQFAELSTSGIKKRPRPVLAAVLALAEQHKIDVIVCSEYERVDRNSDRRAVWKATAEKFSCEFRFANLPPTGNLPDTMESRVIGAVRAVLGELEAARIRERTLPGLMRRVEEGLPFGGRTGAPYGYRWRAKRQGEKTYSGYELEPETAERVRSWYKRLDTDKSATLRQIARELYDAGVPTPSGKSQWTPAAVGYILKNPIYCGRARLLRYAVTWEKRPDEHGELWDERHVTDRLRDPDAWQNETLPLADGVVPQPYLVSEELWQRVQQRIVTLRGNGGKVVRYEYPVDATLLHGGFVRCQHCGAIMARHWRKSPRAERKPVYCCSARAGNPLTTCQSHAIPAEKLDKLVLGMIAQVLYDPEMLCDWAGANESQMKQATREVALADATIDVLRRRVDDLTADAKRYQRVLEALDNVKDAEEITSYRDKLQKVTEAREQAQADLIAALPKLDHVRERDRLLRALRCWSEEWPRVQRETRPTVDVACTPLAPILSHIGAMALSTADTATIYAALEEMPYNLKRRLLHDLNVQVLVSRPRSRAVRAEHGLTPISERVIVRVGELELRLGTAVQGGIARSGGVVNGIPSVTTPKGFYVGAEDNR